MHTQTHWTNFIYSTTDAGGKISDDLASLSHALYLFDIIAPAAFYQNHVMLKLALRSFTGGGHWTNFIHWTADAVFIHKYMQLYCMRKMSFLVHCNFLHDVAHFTSKSHWNGPAQFWRIIFRACFLLEKWSQKTCFLLEKRLQKTLNLPLCHVSIFFFIFFFQF